MNLPNRWVRRLLLWPLPVVLLFLTLTTVPLLALAAIAVSHRLPGKLRVLRALGLAIVYLAVEAVVSVAALVLWIASGFGWKLGNERFIGAHYGLMRWGIRVLVIATQRFFSLAIESDGPVLPSDDGDPETLESPLVVMSRHAGPADSLRQGGHEAAAARAAELRNVLPPRPAGTIAALDACPHADAVFVAHTGLEEIATVGDLWAAIPEHKTIHLTWSVIPSAQIPLDRDGREELLFAAWEAIDRWVAARRPSLPPMAAAEGSPETA